MLETAIAAAHKAGAIISQAAQNLSSVSIGSKGHADFVTEIDRAAEAAIIETLKSAFPNHAFLGEETGHQGHSEFQWIIDPLDGTTNFIHGFPQYAVSIAMARSGVVQHGVVFNPISRELFTASRGRGAFLNGQRLQVSQRKQLSEALVANGFPYRNFEHVGLYLEMQKDLLKKISGLRRLGAASLDLAYVAAGRVDAFFEFGLAPWDVAAGNLLVSEAQGWVTDLGSDLSRVQSANVLAGAPEIVAQLLQILSRHVCQIGQASQKALDQKPRMSLLPASYQLQMA